MLCSKSASKRSCDPTSEGSIQQNLKAQSNFFRATYLVKEILPVYEKVRVIKNTAICLFESLSAY